MSIKNGDACYIDDRFFFQQHQHNGYEIERIFGIKANRLSEFFEPDVWTEIVELTKRDINIVDLLRQSGMDINLLTEGGTYGDRYKNLAHPFRDKFYTFPMNSFMPDITRIDGNLYCHGYYINAHWFYEIRDTIVKELTFPDLTDSDNLTTADKLREPNSVGIHIRRGDFITLNWVIDPKWFAHGVKFFKGKIKRPVFYLFSDDLEWCRQNLDKLGFATGDKVKYVSWNTGLDNYKDMQLMTYCRNLIITNSSFSYLAALLNRNPDKVILNPTEREIL